MTEIRQRGLVLANWLYYPIAYTEIEQGDAWQARAALLRLVESNEALHNILDRRQPITAALTTRQTNTLRLVFEVLPVRFPLYQAYAIDLLAAASERGEQELHIWETPEDGSLLLLALFDILALAERVAKLYALDIVLPAIILHRCTSADPLHANLVAEYLHVRPVEEGAQPDLRHAPYSRAVAIVAMQPRDAQTGAGQERVADAVSRLLRRFGAHFPPTTLAATADIEALKLLLDYFARRYFPISELKTEQVQLLQRALAAKSGIGILPTGFGKSLVFQLYALLTPGTTLVISPLKSLIRDQFLSMHRIGLACVHAITSNDTAVVKQWTQRQLAAHRIRLLYVAPERLRIKGFYDEMLPAGRTTPICALFVDEVHCVSEWGHDFRPAYLAIGDLVHKLSAARGSHVPVIGLTATASRDVRADILEVLHLTKTDVVQLSTSDRANLSLSVHVVDDSLHAKTEVMAELLRTTLPATLKVDAADLLAYPQPEDERYSGVIFGMYANAHGITTHEENVHHIAQELRSALGLPVEAVGIHASEAPTLCPRCGSATYFKRTVKTSSGSQRQNWCAACQAPFERPQPVDKDTWQEQLEDTQDSFYHSSFPVMIATKGYGMGIDKRNIRFIIHHALSGSMESYYQEAGRAGRDGQPAHIALISKLPVRQCYEDYLLRELPPPCVTNAEAMKFWQCPCAQPRGLCDAGRQARFITGNYPGIEKDAQEVVGVYNKLRDLKGADMQINATPGDNDESDTEKQKDLALFRLQQLGLLTNYTKVYQHNGYVLYKPEKSDSWTAQSVAGKLAVYLAHSGLSAEAIDKALEPLKATMLWNTDKKEPASRNEFLQAAAAILLRRVYERVPRMRYTMLSSLLRYAFNDQQRCRRLYIRTYFDDKPPDDNYRCEYCDACQPDLQFMRRMAVIPVADRQLEHITEQLPAILAAFNLTDLRQVVATAEARIAVVSLFEKLNRVLEEDATNVAALFLTGALARRQQGLAGLGLERLRFAFAEGERQGLSQEQLGLIFAEAQAVDAAAAIELIDRRGGVFDNLAGLAVLEQATTSLHGSTSDEARAVRSLRRVRGYQTLHADVATVAEQLRRLRTTWPKSPEPEPPLQESSL